MSSLHPASLILLAIAFLLAASTRSDALLLASCLGVTGIALGMARRHFLAILRRSRWLILTMLFLFGWMTIGTPVPGLPGATREGLHLATDNLARLLIAIAVVALLLRQLEPPALVCGLRALLAPLAPLGRFRDRLSVRLTLTLQAIDAAPSDTGEELPRISSLTLPELKRGPADHLATVAGGMLLVWAALS